MCDQDGDEFWPLQRNHIIKQAAGEESADQTFKKKVDG